ncbi:MAG: methyltransferase [Micrococcales bacterium]|nr:methyltransferase [Micrococcales bacterium]
MTSNDHYFTARPASAEELRSLRVELAGREVEVVTAPGIFSPDHVDHGTQVLLDHAPEPPADGRFLDIGCGWGPIALTLALLRPDADITAVDVNERALDLCRRNAESLGTSRLVAALPEQVPDDAAYDLIWSNPPIRIGKAALHDLLRTWLPRLAPGGAAYLVVQKNLGSDSLQRWLVDSLGEGYAVGRLASSKGFRVLEVRRAG